MIERADQMVLNYVSRAADAAHGVLRPDQRLDFARRLRARIEAERRGSQDARDVAKVLTRFGDPVALVEREARRLAVPPAAPAVEPPMGPPAELASQTPAGPRPTLRLPAVRPATGPAVTGRRGAGSVVRGRPRDLAALVVLALAALLVPVGLPAVAIFQVPVLVWAAGAAAVLFSDTWTAGDKLAGAGAPLLGYTAGGVLVGGFQAAEPGPAAFVARFFEVSGVMFMIGTALGVAWLAYRLLDVS
ncbi:hypothetical protein [Nonomuraea sp. NPDC049758]|uniref:hypothetical protein n=1 Tax=Nonomuraea sp. NPDC049758 TaxID=3154360 RepID=UPI0034157759